MRLPGVSAPVSYSWLRVMLKETVVFVISVYVVFQEHRRTHEITASFKHVGQHAANWGNGETTHLVNADVLQKRLTTALWPMSSVDWIMPQFLRIYSMHY
eukprot:355531-Pyramimonas_sp.AAC.1